MIRFLCILLFAVTAFAGETVKEPELSQSAERKIRERLRSIRIPKIDFRDATVREAVEFLVDKAKRIDPSPSGVGIPLRLSERDGGVRPPLNSGSVVPGLPGLQAEGTPAPPAPEAGNKRTRSEDSDRSPRLTFVMQNASLEEVIEEICRRARLRWEIGTNGIYFTPLAPAKAKKR
jgi:general secretion pathway protein D